jgi:hypothetical protein
MLLRRNQWTHSVILENKIRKLKCWLNLCHIIHDKRKIIYVVWEALWTIFEELSTRNFTILKKKLPTKNKSNIDFKCTKEEVTDIQ